MPTGFQWALLIVRWWLLLSLGRPSPSMNCLLTGFLVEASLSGLCVISILFMMANVHKCKTCD